MSKRHGGCGTLTYARWKSMMARCYQVNATNYRYYGAIGITVCERWHAFASFRDDMGECPSKAMTVDRLDNALPYQPDNCRWATQAEQNRHRSHCVPLTHDGITLNIVDWAAKTGINANALAMRIRLGWTVERTLTQPLKKRAVKK